MGCPAITPRTEIHEIRGQVIPGLFAAGAHGYIAGRVAADGAFIPMRI